MYLFIEFYITYTFYNRINLTLEALLKIGLELKQYTCLKLFVANWILYVYVFEICYLQNVKMERLVKIVRKCVVDTVKITKLAIEPMDIAWEDVCQDILEIFATEVFSWNIQDLKYKYILKSWC